MEQEVREIISHMLQDVRDLKKEIKQQKNEIDNIKEEIKKLEKYIEQLKNKDTDYNHINPYDTNLGGAKLIKKLRR